MKIGKISILFCGVMKMLAWYEDWQDLSILSYGVKKIMLTW